MSNIHETDPSLIPTSPTRNAERVTNHDDLITRSIQKVLLDNSLMNPVNPEVIKESVQNATKTGKPLVFVGIFCPAFKKVEDSDGGQKWTLVQIDDRNHPRWKRLVKEIQNFYSMLNSFGIRSKFSIGFADDELHLEEDADLFWPKEVLFDHANQNQRKIGLDLAQVLPIEDFHFFSHLEFLLNQLGVKANTVEGLRQILIDTFPKETQERIVTIMKDVNPGFKEDPAFTARLCAVYSMDAREVTQMIPDSWKDNAGIIWLFLQTRSFRDETIRQLTCYEIANSSLSVIAPFRNAGGVTGAPENPRHFMTAHELFNDMFGINTKTPEAMISSMLRLDDRILPKLCTVLGISLEKNDHQSLRATKEKAMKTLVRFLFPDFDISSIVNKKEQVKVIEHCLQQGEVCLFIPTVCRVLGQSRSWVEGAIRQGVFTINGNMVNKNIELTLGPNEIRIGKRTVCLIIITKR